MRGYFANRLSDHIEQTPEGFLICHDVPLNRTGYQSYNASEIGVEGEGEVQVWRDPKEVFGANTLRSFESKPVTDGHPPEWVTPENFGAYGKGHVRDLRRGPVTPEGETVIGDLIITDAILIQKILDEHLREISCGYDCEYEPMGDGKYAQKQIRGNHIAVVKDGRAGDRVRIQDEKPKEVRTVKMPEAKDKAGWRRILLGFGLTHMIKTLDAEPEAVAAAAEAAKESEERHENTAKSEDDRRREEDDAPRFP